MMKRQRLIALVLALGIMLTLSPAGSAAGGEPVYVTVCGNLCGQSAIRLLERGGALYIQAGDAALFSGFELLEEGESSVFRRGSTQVSISGGILDNDCVWLPLESGMEQLYTVCIAKNGILLLHGAGAMLEELLGEVDSIFGDEANSLEFIHEAPGTAYNMIATAWDIMSVKGFIYELSGETTRQLYREAVAELVQPPSEGETLLEMTQEINKTFAYWAKLAELLEDSSTGQEDNGGQALIEVLQTLGDDSLINSELVSESLDVYTELGEYIDVEDWLDYVGFYVSANQAYELYITMLQKSVLADKNYDRARASNARAASSLYSAADEIVKYYRGGDADVPALVRRASTYLLSAGVETVIGDSLSLSDFVADAVGLMFEATNIEDSHDAVRKTFALSFVQGEAISACAAALQGLENGDITVENVSLLKYGAMLYLKACRDGYELYDFDSSIGGATAAAVKRIDEKIVRLAAMPEGDICRVVDNAPIDVSSLKQGAILPPDDMALFLNPLLGSWAEENGGRMLIRFSRSGGEYRFALGELDSEWSSFGPVTQAVSFSGDRYYVTIHQPAVESQLGVIEEDEWSFVIRTDKLKEGRVSLDFAYTGESSFCRTENSSAG